LFAAMPVRRNHWLWFQITNRSDSNKAHAYTEGQFMVIDGALRGIFSHPALASTSETHQN
jgi:hypothetical protein